MSVSPSPVNLPDAVREIERLQRALSEAERIRDSYWQIIAKMLPTAPPEFEFTDEEFSSLIAKGENAEEFLSSLFSQRGAA